MKLFGHPAVGNRPVLGVVVEESIRRKWVKVPLLHVAHENNAHFNSFTAIGDDNRLLQTA